MDEQCRFRDGTELLGTMDFHGIPRCRWPQCRSTLRLCPLQEQPPQHWYTYQQHRRHLVNKLKCLDCPREQLLADLKQELTKWRDQGKNVIVCLDANEDIYKDVIGKTLTDPEGLDFVEAFRHAHGRKWSDQGLGG